MKNKFDNIGKKKMSSITRKLHWQLVSSKMKLFFIQDLLFVGLLVGGWIYTSDMAVFGEFDSSYLRDFSVDEITNEVSYKVIDSETEEVLYDTIVNQPIQYGIGGLAMLIVLQNFGILLGYHGETRRIRKTLKPLNEIALQADTLNRLTYQDEYKFQEIESAIESIKPGEEAPLSLGDSDLQGIEAAMNNLLIRMKETYQQQARFVNDASHELRTPIAVIQGYAKLLDRWGKEDEKVLDESVHAIVHEADHMNKLVEQLLFLARGDSGRTILNKQDISLNSMVKEIYEESLMIDEAHIYRFKDSEEELTINADETLIKQAMRILLDNAAKYTKEHDEILISLGKNEDDRPYLQVQDSGIGMAEADVQHMFERFYRSDETREIQGTGLGLSIAKWIIDRHQGHFEIVSRQGLGTRIRIVL